MPLMGRLLRPREDEIEKAIEQGKKWASYRWGTMRVTQTGLSVHFAWKMYAVTVALLVVVLIAASFFHGQRSELVGTWKSESKSYTSDVEKWTRREARFFADGTVKWEVSIVSTFTEEYKRKQPSIFERAFDRIGTAEQDLPPEPELPCLFRTTLHNGTWSDDGSVVSIKGNLLTKKWQCSEERESITQMDDNAPYVIEGTRLKFSGMTFDRIN